MLELMRRLMSSTTSIADDDTLKFADYFLFFVMCCLLFFCICIKLAHTYIKNAALRIPLFVGSLRLFINTFGFCSQVYCLVSFVLTEQEPAMWEVNLILASVGMNVTIYTVELLARDNVPMSIFMHHVVAIIAFVVGFGQPHNAGTYKFGLLGSDDDSPYTIYFATSIGMFATSAFYCDGVMLIYHFHKDNNPVMVWKWLKSGVAFMFLSKIVIHSIFVYVYVNAFDRIPILDRVLYGAACLFWIATEYYLVWVMWVITGSHHKKRVLGITSAPLLIPGSIRDVESQKMDRQQSRTAPSSFKFSGAASLVAVYQAEVVLGEESGHPSPLN